MSSSRCYWLAIDDIRCGKWLLRLADEERAGCDQKSKDQRNLCWGDNPRKEEDFYKMAAQTHRKA